MKIIILEGITTSGKTSVRNELENIFKSLNINYLFINEDETLMPILHNTDLNISVNYLKNLIDKYISLNKQVLIFDRLYLTHIWRVKSGLIPFQESANKLIAHNTTICFLKIPETKISDRIKGAISHREESWVKYVKSKGNTEKDIFDYYINQQKDLLKILDNISINHRVFDTGDMDFKRITQEIISITHDKSTS
jgi:hypothetical protein